MDHAGMKRVAERLNSALDRRDQRAFVLACQERDQLIRRLGDDVIGNIALISRPDRLRMVLGLSG